MPKRRGAKPGDFGQEGYVRDERTAAKVRRLGASLARAEDIAAAVGMSRASLYRHYGDELKSGAAASKLRLLARARKTIERHLDEVKVAQWAIERFAEPQLIGREACVLDDDASSRIGGVLVAPAVASIEDWLEKERLRNASKEAPNSN
ncbi:MAG: hypothetical protein AAGM38_18665 [Pseudomonadota bacterium]